MKTYLLIVLATITVVMNAPQAKQVEKNQMEVKWYYQEDKIYFEVSAPTNGWVTIGFNNSESITGAYLLMGRVIDKKPELVEHYTISPGNYKPLDKLGAKPIDISVNGTEKNNATTLSFSLPIDNSSKYRKNLKEGTNYTMILAYSQSDDFQHHSIMRTSANITL